VCKFIIRACLFLFTLVLPSMISATGLGKLTLNSYLGQPFKAKIDLVSVKKEDISSITVSLASLDTFQLANVDYARFLRTLEFSVENSLDGQPYVKLTSLQPVIEPYFSMLIELNWSSGSLIREYTVRLVEDIPQSAPPVVQQEEPVIPISVKPESIAAEQPDTRTVEDLADGEEPSAKETMLELDIVPEPEPEPEQKVAPQQEMVSAKRSGSTTYGPVKSGDTLAKIAQERNFYHVQLNQILIALLHANREAFIENNVNRLKTGYMLLIPDESEIATISSDVADKEVKMQMANWEAYRQRLVVEASIHSASDESTQIATGEIITTIDDNSTETAHDSPEGVLRLSKGVEEEGWVKEGVEEGGSEDAISIQERLNIVEENSIANEMALNEAKKHISSLEHVMEKNRIANEKELNESNQRIISLKRNIMELQKLLELENSGMADAEARAENILSATSESPPVIEEKPIKVVKAPIESVKGEESNLTIIKWVSWIVIFLVAVGLWLQIKQSRAAKNSKTSDTI